MENVTFTIAESDDQPKTFTPPTEANRVLVTNKTNYTLSFYKPGRLTYDDLITIVGPQKEIYMKFPQMLRPFDKAKMFWDPEYDGDSNDEVKLDFTVSSNDFEVDKEFHGVQNDVSSVQDDVSDVQDLQLTIGKFVIDDSQDEEISEDIEATVDNEERTITAEVPNGTTLSELAPTFVIPGGCDLFDGDTKLSSGSTEVDFSDGSVTLTLKNKLTDESVDYTVTITEAEAE